MTQIFTPTFLPSLNAGPAFHQPRQDQYTRTSLPQSISYSSNYSQRSDRAVDEIPQPRSPVPDINKRVPSPKDLEMYQTHSETSQKREQLPPLSSLFGSSSHPPQPVPTTYASSQSIYPPASPRHAATASHSERSYDGSYFQRHPIPRPYSSNSRSEQGERLGLPPPPRPSHLGMRPESPRQDPRYYSEGPRTHVSSSSVSGWSPHSQSNRPDYFSASRDTSSSFRAHHEHLPQPMIQRREPEPRIIYHDTHQAPPLTPMYPPTPASTVAGEQITTKDGLGPKIWTGTQFLPRFVKQAEVPGEGMCYFYDDGTHCKTVIDGEIVNAHWGVTKAGKPRKRLAIACITCREKKIKCDPDYPRCVQCEKFGRVCKFKNAPRGGQGSPDTPPADTEESHSRPTSSRADGESFKGEKRDSESVSPRQVLRRATPDSEAHHSKRQRVAYNEFTPLTSEASPRPSVQETNSPAPIWNEPAGPSLDHSSLIREWQTNPYTTDPALVTELVSVFFKHVPETIYCMFPEAPFRAWILSSAVEKSLDDLMLVYTVLALATTFSLSSTYKPTGARYAAICRYACDNRPFSIQLVQARLLLSLYCFANNSPEESWDFCGAGLRVATGLRLNVELEHSDDAHRTIFPYGLTRAGYAECRRRTFWSGYIMDRFNGFCSGHLGIFNPEDIFLRLPSDPSSFEAQAENRNPFFDHTTPPLTNIDWKIGSMAYLINITTIWGDVMTQIYRTSKRPVSLAQTSNFIRFYDNATQRLRAWVESLPSFYTFSKANLARAASTNKLSTFVTMHMCYHTTFMKLNRYVQQSTLTQPQLEHHVSVATHHAYALLAKLDTLAGQRTMAPLSPTSFDNMQMKFSSPFVGYSIVAAVDILTAKFTPASIPGRLSAFSGAQYILSELALFWQSSKNQKALVQQRVRDLEELGNSRQEQGGAGAIGFSFGHMGSLVKETADGTLEMREAIEKTFPRDFDCVYA